MTRNFLVTGNGGSTVPAAWRHIVNGQKPYST
jgi:hypothetical protein